MKPGTETKLKFKQLKRRLRLPHWQIIGILETLWRVTEANAPAGDIGRLTNEEIAAAFEWEGDSDELIDVLADLNWLDRDDDFRLIVHDWSIHCPNHMKGGFAKNNRLFADEIARQRAKQPAKHDAKHDAKQPAYHPATYPILPLPNQSLPTNQPPYPPATVHAAPTEATDGSPTDQSGGRAGGNFGFGWGAVADRLAGLGASRWRQAISEAKECGCTPAIAQSIIDHGTSKGFQVGAIICRLSKARPTLPIGEGWPLLDAPEVTRQKQSASRAERDRREAEDYQKLTAESKSVGEQRERTYGPELDAMDPAEVEEICRSFPAMAKLNRKGEKSTLLREWLLVQLERRSTV